MERGVQSVCDTCCSAELAKGWVPKVGHLEKLKEYVHVCRGDSFKDPSVWGTCKCQSSLVEQGLPHSGINFLWVKDRRCGGQAPLDGVPPD